MIPAHPISWHPRGLSDAVDGTNVFSGAMALLANLIPDPATQDVWIARPAQINQVTFPPFSGPEFISCFFPVGDIVYGLISTQRFPGNDEPFAYNLATNTFLPVAGVTAGNVPSSPNPTGPWTPPIMDQVAQRILVTHPGFPGGAVKFGWFDISSFSIKTVGNVPSAVTFTGDTDTATQPFIQGFPVAQITSNGAPYFIYSGTTQPVVAGDVITGTGIAAGTTAVSGGTVSFNWQGDTTAGSATIANLTDPSTGSLSTTGLYAGQIVQGTGHAGQFAFPLPVTIVSINRAAHSMVVSQNAIAGGTFTGNSLGITGTTLQLSQNTTATNDGVTFTVNPQNLHVITGNPNIFGVQPGMTVTDGASVPANTVVVSTSNITASQVGTLTAGNATVSILSQGLSVGMAVAGLGIATGTVITAVGSGTVVLSIPATATISSQLFFTGSSITLSQALTAPGTNIAFTIAGGTPTAPLWGAGDTNMNNLPSVPMAVAQFNSRAYFACGVNGIPFSDAGFPCQISNSVAASSLPPGSGAVQALLPGNGLPVTCFGKLQLQSINAGGVVQGLIAFQRDAAMQQITGDPVLGNFAMNILPVGTGTHAPLSVFSCQLGVGFISPLGLRFVDFAGRVTEPVGTGGQGVSVPFVLANNPPLGGPIDPSRICAASNGNTARISVPTNSGISYEYWYDINRKIWSGPHTCPASLIQVWSDTYLVAPVGINAILRRSDDSPSLTSTYVEGGAQLSWGFASVLLPDNQAGVMNQMVESTVAMSLPILPNAVTASFVDEGGIVNDEVFITGTTMAPGWGGFSWGGQLWGQQGHAFQQFGMDWHQPLIFKQGRIVLNGVSTTDTRLGNLYMKIRPLAYQVARPVGWIDALFDESTGAILTSGAHTPPQEGDVLTNEDNVW